MKKKLKVALISPLPFPLGYCVRFSPVFFLVLIPSFRMISDDIGRPLLVFGSSATQEELDSPYDRKNITRQESLFSSSSYTLSGWHGNECQCNTPSQKTCIPPENDGRKNEQLSPAARSVIEDLKKIKLYRPPPELKDEVMTRIKEKKQSESNE